jgi:hypothetical protein
MQGKNSLGDEMKVDRADVAGQLIEPSRRREFVNQEHATIYEQYREADVCICAL